MLRGLLLDLPFNVFKGLWNEFLVLPRTAIVAFEEAEARFRESIAGLFDLLVPQPSAALAFAGRAGYGPSHFGGGHRAIIFEAGRMQRVLRIVYDGITRHVEPYALAFKRRKDGVARILLRLGPHGGRSGQVGIKSYRGQTQRVSRRPRLPAAISD